MFIVPRLMTPQWLRPLYKVADIVFKIEPVHLFLSSDMHEPFIIAFLPLPYLQAMAISQYPQNVWNGKGIVQSVQDLYNGQQESFAAISLGDGET